MTINKLVRDKIPEIINKKGKTANFRILNEEEFKFYLIEKLIEETLEVKNAESSSDILIELADCLEVIKSIAEIYGSSFEEIEKLSLKKLRKNGGFKKRIFLESTE